MSQRFARFMSWFEESLLVPLTRRISLPDTVAYFVSDVLYYFTIWALGMTIGMTILKILFPLEPDLKAAVDWVGFSIYLLFLQLRAFVHSYRQPTNVEWSNISLWGSLGQDLQVRFVTGRWATLFICKGEIVGALKLRVLTIEHCGIDSPFRNTVPGEDIFSFARSEIYVR